MSVLLVKIIKERTMFINLKSIYLNFMEIICVNSNQVDIFINDTTSDKVKDRQGILKSNHRSDYGFPAK